MNIKTIFCIVCSLFICAVAQTSMAQIGIRIETNNKKYLRYEPVYVKVHLRNYSGHPLAFGKLKGLRGLLKFEVDAPAEGIARRTDKSIPTIEGILLKPGATHEMKIRLSDYYNLNTPGQYKIMAYVEHPQLPSAYQSNYATFTVTEGITVWDRIVGIPDLANLKNSDKIKSRTYRIVSIFNGKNKLFYLVIEDKQKIYTVKKIGYEMGGSVPKCEIDSLSRLHILQQLSSKIYAYFLFDINGNQENREVYSKTNASPTLVRDPKTGSVIVAGGKRAKKNVDYSEDHDSPFE